MMHWHAHPDIATASDLWLLKVLACSHRAACLKASLICSNSMRPASPQAVIFTDSACGKLVSGNRA